MIFKLCLVFILIVVLSYIALFKKENFYSEELKIAINNYADNQRRKNKEQMDIFDRNNKERKFKEMKTDIDKYYDKLEQLKHILFQSNKLVCRDEDLHMPLAKLGVESLGTEDTQTINEICTQKLANNPNLMDKEIIDCIHDQIQANCNKLNATKEACLEFKSPNTGASYCAFTPGDSNLGTSNICESKRLKPLCLHVCNSDDSDDINNNNGCNTKLTNEELPIVVPTKSRIYIKQ